MRSDDTMTATHHNNGMATFSGPADTDGYVRHDEHLQAQRSPLEIPPSPTLTNPDMILPFESERQSSTPSPPFQLVSKGQGSHSLPNDNSGQLYSNPNIGIAMSVARGPPRSPWAYEGHVPGRPLSDIGEEDVQSSPPRATWTGGAPYSHHERHDGSDSGSCSSDTSSTISVKSEREDSVQDHRASGSSNRSARKSTEHVQNSPAQNEFLESVQGPNSMVDSGRDRPPGEESSSAILSSEAERILENAKKRLSLMEGNLTRARSSLRMSSSPSPSPSPHGTPSGSSAQRPVGELYRSISRTDRKRASSLRPRQIYNTIQDGSGNNHSRGHSETNVPSNTIFLPDSSINDPRSLSALGSTSASTYERDDGSFQYNSSKAYVPHRSSMLSQHSVAFGTAEGEPTHKPDRKSSSSGGTDGHGAMAERQLSNSGGTDDLNQGQPADISRAPSQTQVRDLRDQVEGLKSKISSLQKKTQENSLRRRSQQNLQSLRTPSPFTAAEQWYTSALEYRDGYGNLSSNAGYGWNAATQHDENSSQEHRRQEGDKGHPSEGDAFEQKNAAPLHNHYVDSAPDPSHDREDYSVLESHYEDAEDGLGEEEADELDDSEIDRAVLNEILSEPLDDGLDENEDVFEDSASFVAPDATPHEEREDAFDYENFYLHSAMGSFMRNENRRTSMSSTGSVETTRPISPSAGNARPGLHARKMSSDSVSSSATFATATEGWYEPDDDEGDHYEINKALQIHPDQHHSKVSRQNIETSIKQSGHLSASAMAARDRQRSVTPVSAFVSTFVSSISSMSSPTLSSTSSSKTVGETPVPASPLTDDDTRLLEKVFQSLGKVCEDLQEMTIAEAESDPKLVRTLRRRLDAARRVLEGQLDP